MNYRHHIIHNFPQDYPWWKKMIANVIFFFGGTIIHHRKNLLTQKDLKQAISLFQKGDVVLVGGLRRASHLIIRGPVTHSMIYAGKRHFIHSIADGVEIASFHDLACEYDTMIILRHKEARSKQINEMLSCAKSFVGQPYNFDFNQEKGKFYCTQLINSCFKEAKIDTHVKNHKRPIHPLEFINNNFKLIFASHNLKVSRNKVSLVD